MPSARFGRIVKHGEKASGVGSAVNGFCGWAWADIEKLVYGMARGGNDVFVTCCTDGYRPVVFKLEKVKIAAEGR